MSSELSYEEAASQWADLERLGWGRYWDPVDEPQWAQMLTRVYGASWREVAYQRIARAFHARVRALDEQAAASAAPARGPNGSARRSQRS